MFFNIDNFSEGALHRGQPEYTKLDAAFRIINEDAEWAVEIFGRNLSDERIRNYGAPGPGHQRANFAEPRTFGVRLNMYF